MKFKKSKISIIFNLYWKKKLQALFHPSTIPRSNTKVTFNIVWAKNWFIYPVDWLLPIFIQCLYIFIFCTFSSHCVYLLSSICLLCVYVCQCECIPFRSDESETIKWKAPRKSTHKKSFFSIFFNWMKFFYLWFFTLPYASLCKVIRAYNYFNFFWLNFSFTHIFTPAPFRHLMN